MNKFYNSPKTALFIFLIFTTIFFVSAIKIEIGEKQDSKYTVYTVEFEYFGMDASKLEEIITIPLEEKLMTMSGILEFKSDVEYSKSVTSVYFSKKENAKKNYLTIRNIVETLYNTLPSDVQKPRIYTSDSAAKGIFCIAFTGTNVQTDLRDWLESNLKRKIEAVDGVSEVLVTGGKRKEILVNFEPEKAADALLNPGNFAIVIQDGNSSNFQTSIVNKNHQEYLDFDLKIHTLQELKDLPINMDQNITNLGYIADISMVPKEEDEIVTLDGENCISIVVKSSSDGNSINISKECKKILDATDFADYKYKILYDAGQNQLDMIKKVFISLIQSFICIIIIVPLFFPQKRITLLILLLLPVSILWTLGILQLFNISVNQNVIAGITIALGLVVDPLLVIAELSESAKQKEVFLEKFNSQVMVIISATLTTLIALIPLFFIDNIVPGVKTIAAAILIMIIVSLFIELVFVPCFIFSQTVPATGSVSAKIQKFFNYSSYSVTRSSLKNKNLLSVLYLVLIIVPFVFLFIAGKSLSLDNQNNVIYSSIDYEPEVTKEYIEKDIVPLIYKLNQNSDIEFVKSEVTKGSVDFEIGYKKNVKRSVVAEYIQSLDKYIQKGFLYVPGAATKKVTKHTAVELAFSGDDSTKCREYAKKAAELFSMNPSYSSVVLNFKNNEEEYIFYPDNVKLSGNGIDVSSLSSTLRWFMFGPVADKWIEDGKEYDIRVAGKNINNASLEKIQTLLIPVDKGSVPLYSLGEIKKISSPGKVYRKNGRRCAYMTVEIDNVSSDKAISMIQKDLKQLPLERGYSYTFNYELTHIKSNYKLLYAVLILSIVEILIVIIFLTENLKKSLIIISTVPVSLFIPLLLKFITQSPILLGDIVGIIILSGITVNNIVYILESELKNIMFKVRSKTKSILVSSFTTIASAAPLLFMSSDSFSKSISYFMIFGMLNSIVCSFLFVPAVIKNTN